MLNSNVDSLFRFKEKLIVFSLLFIVFGCDTKQNVSSLYTIPLINVKMGSIDTLELSNYFRTGEPHLAFAEYSSHKLENHKLIINGIREHAGIEILKLRAGKENFSVIIRYVPMVRHEFKIKLDTTSDVFVMGQFNDWSRNSLPMKLNGDYYSTFIYLEPKTHEYKFVVDSDEILDPENTNIVSNNAGGWNSQIDYSSMYQENTTQLLKSFKRNKTLFFDLYDKGKPETLLDFLILFNNQIVNNYGSLNDEKTGLIVDISNFSDGSLRVFAVNSQGIYTPENHTIISGGKPIDSDSDSWYLSIMYNPMVDRFHDGDPSNNESILDPKLHYLTNFIGGDLRGIIEKINDNYFSDLGINTIWLSPVQTQPDSSWVEYIEPNRTFTGYHGYWPIEPREIDRRYGTSKDLKELVKTANELGIKIILDFVSNHVHQNHPYFKNNRDWFGDLEMDDGGVNIRKWDGDTRLTTWFDEFLPSYNFVQSDEAVDKVVQDALWWLSEYNLDGFRQDAVKHVPHKFWKKLTRSINQLYPEKVIYQIGETFGSDELILSYVNPSELSAQFNFGIYFNTRNLFSDDQPEFAGLKQIIHQNAVNFGPIHLMGNITSSHDQLRFISYADGQISLAENGVDRAFNSPVTATQNKSAYRKLANYHAFNSSQPGIPIIYYGEEIGLVGELDPGNRRPMKFNIDDDEKKLLEKFKNINRFRKNYPSLSIGDQTILISKGALFVTLKTYFDEQVICAINNGPNTLNPEIRIPMPYSHIRSMTTNRIIDKRSEMTSIIMEPYSHDFFLVEK